MRSEVMPGAKAPSRETQVKTALEHLERSLEVLKDAELQLAERLKFVMRNQPPRKSESPDKQVTSDVPLVMRIDMSRGMVDECRERICGLLELLEI